MHNLVADMNDPVVLREPGERPILKHSCLYDGGLVIGGNRLGDIELTRGLLETIKSKSPTARLLIERLNKWNSMLGRDLMIFSGPAIIKATNCGCPNCTAIRLSGKEFEMKTSYNLEANYIIYNTNECKMYDGSEPWMNVPPELIIAHELIHAYHHSNGTVLMGMNEEYQTVGLGMFADMKFTENAIRKDYGLPLRTRY